MRSAKERHKAVPASVLQDANKVIPPALFARAARVTTSVAARHPSEAPVNTVISNVPGSPMPLYLAGARLEALYPVSAIMHGVGLNITVMSYLGGLNFGVVADRDMVDDPWPLATRSPGPRPNSSHSLVATRQPSARRSARRDESASHLARRLPAHPHDATETDR